MENHPYYPERGTHDVSFSRTLWVERDDFMEEPVKGYFRLFPGNEVRLKSAYVVRCTGCVKDENGNVVEITATYDPQTKGGTTPDGRKVKGTIHWVDAATAKTAEVRLYSSLFLDAEPEAGDNDYLDVLNRDSLETLTDCKVEAGILPANDATSFQFMRLGYFCIDNVDSTDEHPVFNRSVSLKDSFNKK